MAKIISILNALIAGEMAVENAVPVVAHGALGNILGIVLLSEATASGLLTELSKTKAASTVTSTVAAAPIAQAA